MTDTENRRPLKVRGVNTIQRFARWLAKQNITPNQISLTSVFFAACAATCLFLLSQFTGWQYSVVAILAAVFIQLRLLCNLFDGMVAVEGGKGTPSGELFNDIPDRVADPLILAAAGYSITAFSFAAALGWLCAVLAVMTAYTRALAASIGAPVDFRGPMAKQHRMAIVTVAAVFAATEPMLNLSGYAMTAALLIIAAGCAITVGRRARAAYLYLETKKDV